MVSSSGSHLRVEMFVYCIVDFFIQREIYYYKIKIKNKIKIYWEENKNKKKLDVRDGKKNYTHNEYKYKINRFLYMTKSEER